MIEPARSPFMGLGSFSEADRDIFHGRETETDELFQLVQREHLAVVFGMSGLGKSSLLRAGLFPRLREASLFPIVIRLTYRSGDLVAQIRTAIAAQIEDHHVDAAPPDPEQTLWEYFHRTPFWDARNRLLVPVLVFDQFEELFTLGERDQHRAQLLEQLGDLVENRIPESFRGRGDADALPESFAQRKAKVVLSLREDYLARLEDLRAAMPSLARGRFRLHAMDGSQALRAIRHERTEHLISPEVAETVARFVAGTEEHVSLDTLTVEPALLSLVCRQLDELRMARGEQAISAALLSGESARILESFYEQTISGLDPRIGPYIEEHLLTPDGHRTTVAVSAIEHDAIMARAIDSLVDRRLLRIEERLGRPHVEVIHDVLTHVMVKRRNERRGEAARRRRSMRRLVALGGASVLVAGVVGAVLYFGAQRQLAAKAEAQDREFAAQKRRDAAESSNTLLEEATLHADDDFWSAARLIEVAYKIAEGSPSPELAALVGRVTAYEPVLAAALHVDDEPALTAFSRDGSRLFVASSDGTVTFWDTTRWSAATLVPPVQPGGGDDAKKAPPHLLGFAASADGSRAVTLVSGKLTVWDLGSARPIATTDWVPASASPGAAGRATRAYGDVRVNRDATWIAVQGAAVSIWHLDGTTLDPWAPPASSCTVPRSDGFGGAERRDASTRPTVSFSSDGKHLALRDSAQIRVFDLSGSPRLVRKPLCGPSAAIALSSDGSALGIANDRASRERACLLQHGAGAVACDSDLAQPDVELSRAETGAPVDVPGTGVDFDPAESDLALVTVDGGVELRDVSGALVRKVVLPCRPRQHDLRARKLVVLDSCGDLAISDDRRQQLIQLPLEGGGRPAVSGELVAEPQKDGTVRVWRLREGPDRILAGVGARPAPISEARVFAAGAPSSLGTLAVTRDGKTVVGAAVELAHGASSSAGQILGIFDVTGDAITQLNKARMDHPPSSHHEHGVNHVELDADDGLVLTVGRDRHARIWRRADGSRVLDVGDERTRPVLFAGFTPQGTRFVTAERSGKLCLWDVASGHTVACAESGGEPSDLAVTPRGAVVGDTRGNVLLWDLVDGHAPTRVGHHGLEVEDVALDPSGRWLASASDDGTASVRDLQTCAAECKEIVHLEESSEFYEVRFVELGSRTFLLATSHDARGYLVPLDDPSKPRRLELNSFASTIDVRRDRVLLCEWGVLEEWDLGTARLTGSLDLRSTSSDADPWCEARYLPDGRIITHYTDGTLALWSHAALASGLEGSRPITEIALSPDRQQIATFDGVAARQLSSGDGALGPVVPAATAPSFDAAGHAFLASRDGVVERLDGSATAAAVAPARDTMAADLDGGQALAVDRNLRYRLAATDDLSRTTERQLASKLPHGAIFDAEAAPSGTWFVAAARDGSLVRYDADGVPVARVSLDHRARALVPATGGDGILAIADNDVVAWPSAGSPSTQHVVPGLSSRSAAWDTRAGLLLATSSSLMSRDLGGAVRWARQEDFKFYVPDVAVIVPGASPLAIVASELQLGVFSFDTGTPLTWFNEYGNRHHTPQHLWLLPDRKRLLSLDETGAELWDVPGAKLLATDSGVSLVKGPGAQWLRLHYGALAIARIGEDGEAGGPREVFASEQRLDCKGQDPDEFRVMAWSPDGSTIAAAAHGDAGDTICLWNEHGEPQASWQVPQEVFKLVFVGAHRLLALGDGTPQLWSAPDGKLVRSLVHEDLVAATFVLGNPYVITADTAGIVRVYDARSSTQVAQTADVRSAGATKIELARVDRRSGTLLIADDRGGFATIAIPSGRIERSVPGDGKAPSAIAISDGGTSIALAFDSEVKVWSGTAPARSLEASQVEALAFSPDGRWLATADGLLLESGDDIAERGLIGVWVVETGQRFLSLPTLRALASVAWSADGSELAVGGAGGFVELFAIPRETRPPPEVSKIIDRLAPRRVRARSSRSAEDRPRAKPSLIDL